MLKGIKGMLKGIKGDLQGLKKPKNLLIYELYTDSKGLCHVPQGQGAVGLEELAVGVDPHLPYVVSVVRGKQPVLLHLLFYNS